ncbi:HCLS1-associated protein X-1-like [Sinocyclocheilus grahami]|uniref:HCLS1-associated protein X-1-like n=1 Tax=Sinocyclocheilus grahami TaxID=75366 RepID=A0A672T9N7_SINGR|nr:PREDICTED: HCLS1-associated protein X-1-like [Sinocyclocheilus grahami]
MSVFDLFRGFFGVPGGHYRGDGRRDPFFEGMIHEDEDEDDDNGFHHDDFNRPHRDPFNDAFRFGFSFGPGGMRFEDPQLFGQIFRDMEEIFASLDRFDERHGIGHRGAPSEEAPPPQEGAEKGRGGAGSSNPIRDFMLKSPDSSPYTSPLPPPSEAPKDRHSSSPQDPSSHFPQWRPFSKFHDLWKDGLLKPKEGEKKEDGDLDSQVSSGGLDQILTPAPSQPNIRSTFKSVSVTKVVRPDGTVEERRTVRDGEGNEETTVTISGPGVRDGPQDQSGLLMPGGLNPSVDMQDDFSEFSKFFRGFRG